MIFIPFYFLLCLTKKTIFDLAKFMQKVYKNASGRG